ncbi:MAG: FecR domain-containing protein, partial [Myxococcales bacterium]|nr:FecR domain-containing protein [Myxococcales bacterium]
APRDISLLRGQAVFDVITSGVEGASFDVQTVAGRAVASGSRFLVKTSAESAEVAVARGVVQVTARRGASAELHAGEESELSGEAPPQAKPAPRVSYLFDFARKSEADALPGVPESKSTLVGRDPRWQKEAPLDLRDFAVDVHVEGGFARTTIDQTFFNPKPRQLEGVYSFPMPKGAAISRLAMYVDGTLMESAIVDRSRGRDIYEGIVEQRRDPALLEWMTGNTFRMRIFPIPGRTEKRIFMSYTQPLEHLYGSDRLVVPIPPIDQLADHAKFSVRVVDGGRYEIGSPSHPVEITDKGADRLVTLEQKDVRLGQDLVITMREKDRADGAGGDDEARVFDEGDTRYLLARSSPELRKLAPAERTRRGRRIAVLFDVSASRSEQALAAQARFVDGLIDAFDETDEVTFLTVGHEVSLMPGGLVPARRVRREEVARFLSGKAEGLGDTRLDLGLSAASGALGEGEQERQVIYVGDGIFVGQGLTPSKTSQAEQLVSALGGRTRFIGVGIGDTVDRGTLDAVANATHGLSIEVGESEDLGHRAFDLVATTYTPCLSGLSADLLDANGRPISGASVALRSTRVCDGERIEVVTRAGREIPAAKVRVHGR